MSQKVSLATNTVCPKYHAHILSARLQLLQSAQMTANFLRGPACSSFQRQPLLPIFTIFLKADRAGIFQEMGETGSNYSHRQNVQVNRDLGPSIHRLAGLPPSNSNLGSERTRLTRIRPFCSNVGLGISFYAGRTDG